METQPYALSIVMQPPNSKLCGQCMIATLANQKLDHVINHLGVQGTRFQDLFDCLYYYGVQTEHWEDFHVGIPKDDGMTYICLIVWPRRSTGHWVIYRDGDIYCSHRGQYKYIHKDKEHGLQYIKWYWRVFRRIKL